MTSLVRQLQNLLFSFALQISNFPLLNACKKRIPWTLLLVMKWWSWIRVQVVSSRTISFGSHIRHSWPSARKWSRIRLAVELFPEDGVEGDTMRTFMLWVNTDGAHVFSWSYRGCLVIGRPQAIFFRCRILIIKKQEYDLWPVPSVFYYKLEIADCLILDRNIFQQALTKWNWLVTRHSAEKYKWDTKTGTLKVHFETQRKWHSGEEMNHAIT